ncbi:hypothetical protein ACOI1H_25845, partial [Loktanella sp. DJP18]|uniref:hypothetical protein n=1 Tax=Loktanella sp. DJP18 TaxID=3409788 RepID=UPI003BB7183F
FFPNLNIGKFPARAAWGETDRLREGWISIHPTPRRCTVYAISGGYLIIGKVGLGHDYALQSVATGYSMIDENDFA